MHQLICFGEALIDFLQIKTEIQDKVRSPIYQQFPGGAPANVAVACSKLGGSSSFLGQVGNDSFGNFIEECFKDYQVNTDYLLKHESANTGLAFVQRNLQGERSFEFVRKQSADMLLESEQIKTEWFDEKAILHFSSNTLTSALGVEVTQHVIHSAKSAGCIISFDVNLRHNLWSEGQANKEPIETCLLQADIIKVSLDELEYIEPKGIKHFATKYLSQGSKVILITDGANPVKLLGMGMHSTIKTPTVNAIDTTAAGDTFMGGFLYGLCQQEDIISALQQQEILESITVFASICGALSTTRKGAFPSMPSLEEVEEFNL